MSDSKDDETKFNETLKRMLNTPPKPRKTSGRQSKTPKAPKSNAEDPKKSRK